MGCHDSMMPYFIESSTIVTAQSMMLSCRSLSVIAAVTISFFRTVEFNIFLLSSEIILAVLEALEFSFSF